PPQGSRGTQRQPARSPPRPGASAVPGSGAGPEQEDQPELADLDLIARSQDGFLDPLPVDVRAIQAADIPDAERAAMPVELGVPPGHRHIVQEYVAVRVPADQCQVTAQQEPAAGV